MANNRPIDEIDYVVVCDHCHLQSLTAVTHENLEFLKVCINLGAMIVSLVVVDCTLGAPM